MLVWLKFGLLFFYVKFARADSNLRCLVCQSVVDTIYSAIKHEDPHKKIQIGSFRIEPDGSQKQATVPYAGSELHLHEILETVCDSMNDFAQAKHKETSELTLLNLSKDIERLSIYELIPDLNLNHSLKHYCEVFVEEHEEDILETMTRISVTNNLDLGSHLCKTKAGYCKYISQSKRHEEL